MPDRHQGTFHLSSDDAGLTLAALLRQRLTEASWSDAKRLPRARRVLVDGNLCLDEARRLKGTEVVKVLSDSAAPIPSEVDVRIRYIDSQIVIVEKPAGMTSIRYQAERDWPRKRKQVQPTLDEVLPRIIAKLRKGGRRSSAKESPAVRPVHRLDRETSGLMVFARTAKAEQNLGKQFHDHTIERKYLAVVQGTIRGPRTFESWIARDRGDGRRGGTEDHTQGKHAITHVTPIEWIDGYSVVECRLETGRTHQIRIHLAEAGHPLCGERVYNKPLHGKEIADPSRAPRIALHAQELGLTHPATGEHVRFEMPPPRDFAQLIARLRTETKRAGR
jgi:23S rRNA pseudouridine1911/1915/1917 synthase